MSTTQHDDRTTRSEAAAPPPADAAASDTPAGRLRAEDGSLIAEYGLIAVVAATIAAAVMAWASNGALVTLFNALLRSARGLVGA